jgi:hypothetical protein
MVCLDSAALNSRDGPDFAPQLCYARHSREAGSCNDQLGTFSIVDVSLKAAIHVAPTGRSVTRLKFGRSASIAVRLKATPRSFFRRKTIEPRDDRCYPDSEVTNSRSPSSPRRGPIPIGTEFPRQPVVVDDDIEMVRGLPLKLHWDERRSHEA